MMICWPEKYDPSRSAVHVRNDLYIEAPAEIIWAWLIRAALWPSWYSNSANVRFLNSRGPDLEAGAKFRWKTFGVTIESQVIEFVPGERIAWNASAIGIDAYHAWVIEPAPGGCRVLTEETQNGMLARLSSLVMPNRMHRYHQIWLESLREKARKGFPPDI